MQVYFETPFPLFGVHKLLTTLQYVCQLYSDTSGLAKCSPTFGTVEYNTYIHNSNPLWRDRYNIYRLCVHINTCHNDYTSCLGEYYDWYFNVVVNRCEYYPECSVCHQFVVYIQQTTYKQQTDDAVLVGFEVMCIWLLIVNIEYYAKYKQDAHISNSSLASFTHLCNSNIFLSRISAKKWIVKRPLICSCNTNAVAWTLTMGGCYNSDSNTFLLKKSLTYAFQHPLT